MKSSRYENWDMARKQHASTRRVLGSAQATVHELDTVKSLDETLSAGIRNTAHYSAEAHDNAIEGLRLAESERTVASWAAGKSAAEQFAWLWDALQTMEETQTAPGLSLGSINTITPIRFFRQWFRGELVTFSSGFELTASPAGKVINASLGLFESKDGIVRRESIDDFGINHQEGVMASEVLRFNSVSWSYDEYQRGDSTPPGSVLDELS